MALKIQKFDKGGPSMIVLIERHFLTRDGRLVEAGHPDAATLYCAPGHSVPRAEYEALAKASKPKPDPKTELKPKSKTAPKNKGA